MFEEDDIEETEGFAKRSAEAEAKLKPAVEKGKKPKIGPATYTLKSAAKEAIDDDEKKKKAEGKAE